MPNDHVRLAAVPITDSALILQQEALEAAEIASYIHRENGVAGLVHQLVPMQYLVLVHREDLEQAQAILAAHAEVTAAAPAGSDWRCEKCGESCEASFTSCWKCGHDRDAW